VAPFGTQIGANAMLSQSSLTGCPQWDPGCPSNPLKNLNGLINPPGAPPGNGGTPYDDVWSGNAYYGPWSWTAYLFGSCYPVPTDFITGNSMPLSGACTPNFSQWQGLWDQDLNSTYNPSLLTRRLAGADRQPGGQVVLPCQAGLAVRGGAQDSPGSAYEPYRGDPAGA
jgi:hypothetical protein